jgi:hypothetical protein
VCTSGSVGSLLDVGRISPIGPGNVCITSISHSNQDYKYFPLYIYIYIFKYRSFITLRFMIVATQRQTAVATKCSGTHCTTTSSIADLEWKSGLLFRNVVPII